MNKVKKMMDEKYLLIIKIFSCTSGLGMLAFSNKVIDAINIVKSTRIGIIYFSFILFGLLSCFESIRLISLKNKVKCIVMSLGGVVFGIWTYYDLTTTYIKGDISNGKFVLMIGIIFYAVVFVGLIVDILRESLCKKN